MGAELFASCRTIRYVPSCRSGSLRLCSFTETEKLLPVALVPLSVFPSVLSAGQAGTLVSLGSPLLVCVRLFLGRMRGLASAAFSCNPEDFEAALYLSLGGSAFAPDSNNHYFGRDF